MTKIRLLGLAGALVSIGFYISLFLTLVLLYSLNYWLGLAVTVVAFTYYARREILNQIAKEVLSDGD